MPISMGTGDLGTPTNPLSNMGYTPQSQMPYLPNPSYGNNAFGYLGTPQFTANPLWFGGGGTRGSMSMGDMFSGGGSSGFSSGSSGSANTSSNINNTFSGGGQQSFDPNQPQGYNPYQFMPSFANFQRPDSPVAGETPEEEFLRQYMMGQLLGDQPGQDEAYNQLFSTVSGDYLSPETNPFLGQIINALGEDTSHQLNRSVNDILSRAGTAGALGGSRSALMQGTAAGEATRGFNTNVADLLNKNYQNERQLQLGAIPGLLQTEGMPIQQAMQAMTLAGIPREFQQQVINANMQEWLRQQSERMLPIQVGQSVMGQRMGQQIPIVQQGQSPLAGLGQLGQGLGSLASGASSLGSMFGGGGSGGGSGMSNPLNIFNPSSWGSLFGGAGGGGAYSLADSSLGGLGDLEAIGMMY